MWFAGIDWADVHHDVVVIDGEGYQVGARRVTHTPEGLTALTEFLAAITGPERKAELACIIETTHGLLIPPRRSPGKLLLLTSPRSSNRSAIPRRGKWQPSWSNPCTSPLCTQTR